MWDTDSQSTKVTPDVKLILGSVCVCMCVCIDSGVETVLGRGRIRVNRVVIVLSCKYILQMQPQAGRRASWLLPMFVSAAHVCL